MIPNIARATRTSSGVLATNMLNGQSQARRPPPAPGTGPRASNRRASAKVKSPRPGTAVNGVQATAVPGSRPVSAAIDRVSAANSAVSQLPGFSAQGHHSSRVGSSRSARRAPSPTSRPPSSAGSSSVGPSARRGRPHRDLSPALQAWTTTSSAAVSRRGSVAFSEDGSGHNHHAHAPPTEAWAAFENSIKEIADDTLYFTQRQPHRSFRSSDVYKQVLTDLNYVPQVEVTHHHDDDDVSLLSFRPGSAAGDGSVAPSAADGEWADRQSVLSFAAADDDCLSVGRTSTLGRKSPGVHFHRDRGYGDYAASTATGRLSPAEEEPGESDDERGGSGGVAFIPVADLYSDDKDVRSELYQRYLHRPDMWTEGLTRHLQKTVTRERLPASKVWRTTQIFRPKSAIVNGNRLDTSAARGKRAQSAHGNLPSLRSNDPSRMDFRRGSSARSYNIRR